MRSPLGNHSILLCLFVVSLAFAGTAFAQTDVEVNAAIEFDFSTPGARSLSLGGAFVALADDATAAFTNPAGLIQLTRPEIAIEGRRRVFRTTFTDSGNSGTPTGSGIDTVEGIVDGETSSDINNLSFLSFVYPKKRWAVAAYRHELANFETRFQTQGAFLRQNGNRLRPVQASLNFEVENLGLAVAIRVGEKLSIGLGVSSFDFSLSSKTNRFRFEGGSFEPGGFFDVPTFMTTIANSQTLEGGDSDLSFNVGLLWSASKTISLGAAFRRGASFDLDGICVNCVNPLSDFVRAEFNVPDVFSIGLSIRPNQKSIISFEYDRVTYSDLTQNVPPLVSIPGDATDGSTNIVTENLKTKDAGELHVGFEHLFLTKNPIGIRFGAWYDPDHRTRLDLTLDEALNSGALADFALFRPGDDIVHYTFGLGISVGEHFQIDAGIDLSERVDTGSLSAVFRF